jgi:hypothetical protein
MEAVMTTIVYEFDSQAELEQVLTHLWDRLAIGGEVVVHPLPEGTFRLEIVTEKPLRPATLEKLPGRRVAE